MKKLLFVFIVFLVSAWQFFPRSYHAVAELERGLEIQLTISALSGFRIHSDWHRKIAVSFNGKQINKTLFDDTGWWRGSNLYKEVSGTYVFHDGQIGCFRIVLEPLEFVVLPRKFCLKSRTTIQASDHKSKYYQNLRYWGHFYESPQDREGRRVRFADFRERSEIALPDPL